jgi:hypothetical protein
MVTEKNVFWVRLGLVTFIKNHIQSIVLITYNTDYTNFNNT